MKILNKFEFFKKQKNFVFFLNNKNQNFAESLQDTFLEKLGLKEAKEMVDKAVDTQRTHLKDDVVETRLEKQEEQSETLLQKEGEVSTGSGGGSSTGQKKKQTKKTKEILLHQKTENPLEHLSEDVYMRQAKKVKAKTQTALKLLSLVAPKDFKSKNHLDQAKEILEMKTKKYKEVWKESSGLLQKLKNSFFLFCVKRFSKTKNGKNLFSFFDKIFLFGKKAEEIKENLAISAESAKEKLKGLSHFYKKLRTKPELDRKEIHKGASNLKTTILKITKKNKNNPEKAKQLIKAASTKFMKESQSLNPEVFREEIKKGKLAGFSIKAKVIRLSLKPLLRCFKEQDFSAFKKTIKSEEFKQTAKETLIPFVGLKNSYQRLQDGNSEIPLWARRAEVGINALSDGLFVAGSISALTGIGSGLGGLLAGGGYTLKTLGRLALKGTLNVVRKLATKQGLKTATKEVGILAARELKWGAIFSLGFIGAEKFYEKLFPDGIVAEAKTRAFETFLTPEPEQQAYAKFFGVAPDET